MNITCDNKQTKNIYYSADRMSKKKLKDDYNGIMYCVLHAKS